RRHGHERRAGGQHVGQDHALGGAGPVVGEHDGVGGVGPGGDGGGAADRDGQVRRGGRGGGGEVGDGGAPGGGGLGVGELVGRPERAVDRVDVDAAEVAGPVAARKVVVVGQAAAGRHLDGRFHGAGGVGRHPPGHPHRQVVRGRVGARLHVAHA